MPVDPDEGVSYSPDLGDVAALENGEERQSSHVQKRQHYLVKRHRQRHVGEELHLPEAVQWWSCDDVAKWINFVGFPQYANNFFDNDVSGEALLLLQKDDLAAMQISSVGERILILNAIQRVQKYLAQGTQPAWKEDLKISIPGRSKYSVPSLSQLQPDSARSIASSG